VELSLTLKALTGVARSGSVSVMFEAAVTEFPFVQALPKREKSRLGRLWDHFQEVRAAVKENGALLPQHYAADLLGLSRQRVHVLVNEGKLKSIEVGGLRYVTESSLVAWAQAERDKGGRPSITVPGIRKTFSMARQSAIESPKKIS
jgi:hypothetical protein